MSSQINDDIALGLGAADQYIAVRRCIDRIGPVADRPAHKSPAPAPIPVRRVVVGVAPVPATAHEPRMPRALATVQTPDSFGDEEYYGVNAFTPAARK